ncbi:MAG: hypothetical protein RR767_14000 [Acinetobacter sp.]
MKYYQTTRVYLTAYLLYRTRLMYKISLRQMHKYVDLKQSTYAKIETGALKLTLDNFFTVLIMMGFTLTDYEEFLKKIDIAIHGVDIFKNVLEDEDEDEEIYVYESPDQKSLSVAICECETYDPTEDTEEDRDSVTNTKDVRGFDDLFGAVTVAKIDLLLAEHYTKYGDHDNRFQMKL